MPTRKFLFLILLSAVSAVAALPDFLLGVDYSEWLSPNTTKLATDNSGAIYVLTSFGFSSTTPPSTVTKLSADGKTILWRNQLAFPVSAMAVDPNGGVYVTPFDISGVVSVAKLTADGTGNAWTEPVGLTLQIGFTPTIAVDSTGRVYLAAFAGSDTQIVRVNAAGTAVDYRSHFQGMPTSIAADASGSAFVAGNFGNGVFLARFAPDGTAGFYSNPSGPQQNPTVVLDASGNGVVYSGGVIRRFDAAGQLTSSKTIATWGQSYPGLALDAGGNAYVVGSVVNSGYAVKNSLAQCRTDLLTVAAPDGTILQTTYVPDVSQLSGAFLVNRDSSILLAALPVTGAAPTRTGPFAAGADAGLLLRLAPNTNAQPLSLVCSANGATYKTGPVSPGELFILYGNHLGPADGVEFRATVDRPYPTRLADAEVTFDGKQAPLIYAQDGQINLLTPSSLIAGHNTEICVSYQGVKENCRTLPVAATDPGVFTVNGYAIAYNADGSQNSATNPAAANSLVSVFATGLGPLTQPQPDGAIMGSPFPGNVLPVGVYGETPVVTGIIGTISVPAPTEVTFAGPALYHPVGISQITFRIMHTADFIVSQYYVALPSTQTRDFSIFVAP